jgi:WD40 repeat protein
VAFSPDGRRLASAGIDGTVRVWDAAGGQELLSLQGHTGAVYGVAYSPDGRRLASAGIDGTVRMWDAAGGQELLALQGHTDVVNGVVFSPDGRRLASAGGDGTVRVWDAARGRELFALQEHKDPVWGVAFSPDGRRLASAGVDKTVRVWDAAGGQELLTLKGHTDEVNAVVFSPDGQRLASASDDKTVRVWEARSVPAEVWRQRALVSDVHALFTELVSRTEVLAALRKDPTLSEADRDFALEVACTFRDDPEQWNNAAWQVVRVPGGVRDAYALALRQAKAAVQFNPGNGKYLTTLCAAHYRVDDWTKALETLERSGKLNGPKYWAHPADLAFLAMTLHQLGREVEAQATLLRLRDVISFYWKSDTEAQGFQREAEELIDGKPADKKP